MMVDCLLRAERGTAEDSVFELKKECLLCAF